MSEKPRLARIRLKVERAKQHARDLEAAMSVFRNSKPYGLVADLNPDTGDKVYRIQVYSPTPESFALLIGDAIHNLRSALDHLAWQLVLANGKEPSSKTYFPVSERLAINKAEWKAKIEGMSTGAQELINTISSDPRSSRELWVLTQLNVIDKHRILIVTAFGHGGMYYWCEELPDGSMPNQGFQIQLPAGMQPDGTYPLIQSGAIVSYLRPPIEYPDNVDMQIEIEVAFTEPQIVHGKPVVPFLHELCEFVDGIIGQFEPFL